MDSDRLLNPSEANAPIILYGAGSQALVIAEIAQALKYDIVGLLNDGPVSRDDLPYPIYFDLKHLLEAVSASYQQIFFSISIGNEFGRERHERYVMLATHGLVPATLVHPTAFVSPSVVMGAALQVMPFAMVHTRARIGEPPYSTRVRWSNTNAISVGEPTLAPEQCLCGRVRVGDFCFIGAGATVIPDVQIGDNVIIGAGSTVIENLPSGGIYAGVPARQIGTR